MTLEVHLKDKQVVAVVDLGYGDSGKGKVTHRLAHNSDVVVRCTGGPNTGATLLINGKSYALHLLPAAIAVPGKRNIVTGIVFVNPEIMFEEIVKAREHGFIERKGDLVIGDKLPVILPYHIAEDKIADIKGIGRSIGTTARGVGPCMKDFVGRHESIALRDLFDRPKLEDIVAGILHFRQAFLDQMLKTKGIDKREWFRREFKDYSNEDGDLNPRRIANAWCTVAEELKPFVEDTDMLLQHAYNNGDRILIEGTQGALLDVLHGVRPFVTSSTVMANGLLYCSGLPKLDYIVCVTKALPTKVGEGLLPTEICGEEAEELRKLGNEYGATTGRPRRLYWPNIAELKYALGKVASDRGIVITKFDILEGRRLILYNGYRFKNDHRGVISEFSNDTEFLSSVEGANPQTFGPFESLRGVRIDYELKGTCVQDYIEYLEDRLETDVIMIGNGPGCYENIEF